MYKATGVPRREFPASHCHIKRSQHVRSRAQHVATFILPFPCNLQSVTDLAVARATTAKGPSTRSTPFPPQAVLHDTAEQCPAVVRIYLQSAPPGWPSARPVGVLVPVPIVQVAPEAFACVAVPTHPVVAPVNVSVTPDDPVGAV